MAHLFPGAGQYPQLAWAGVRKPQSLSPAPIPGPCVSSLASEAAAAATLDPRLVTSLGRLP